VGDCFHLVAYAGYATFVDPDGVETYLDEMPLAQRCDYGAISSNKITHEDEAHIRELISETRRFDRAIGGIVSPFSEAWWSWKTNRESRRQAGIGWLGLPELVWAFRCERPFRFGDRANWLWVHRQFESERRPNAAIRRWQGRIAWCRAYGQEQVDQLTIIDKTEHGPDAKGNSALLELARNYEDRLAAWSSQY